MRWSLTIGRFGGTAVKIHVTFLLLLAWIGFSRAGSRAGRRRRATAWSSSSLLFACVVLHEFGHILVARRYGIKTPDVTLLPIGGVASLQSAAGKAQPGVRRRASPGRRSISSSPSCCCCSSARSMPADLARLDDPRCRSSPASPTANLFLAVFNLIPAFPMDGGRVLHALLAMKLGRPRAHADRRDDRPGVRLRARLPRPVRQSAADLHRHLRLRRRGGRGADDGAARDRRAASASARRWRRASPRLPADARRSPTRSTRCSPPPQHEFPVVDAFDKPIGLVMRDDISRRR